MELQINNIPNIDHSMKFLIEHADILFKGKKLKIEVVDKYDKTKKLVRIYINDSLALWFYKELETKEAVYDGWEMGDYSKV